MLQNRNEDCEVVRRLTSSENPDGRTMLPRSADPVGFLVNSEAVASSAYAVACMLPALFAAKVLVVSVGCNKLGH